MRVDAAKAGTLTGRVLFDGPAPANPPIKMTADPMCLKANPNGAMFETFMLKDGGLDNVFVMSRTVSGTTISTFQQNR